MKGNFQGNRNLTQKIYVRLGMVATEAIRLTRNGSESSIIHLAIPLSQS